MDMEFQDRITCSLRMHENLYFDMVVFGVLRVTTVIVVVRPIKRATRSGKIIILLTVIDSTLRHLQPDMLTAV